MDQQPAPATFILTRGDIAALMTVDDYLESAREAFLALGNGRALSPMPLYLPAEGGGIHGKGALLRTADGAAYAAVKVNANFPGNPKNAGLPTIQGAVVLSDAKNGCLLAVMDSIEVTLRRTAAASALAARHLARPESAVLAICGCGGQARPQLDALAGVFKLRQIYAWDVDFDAAKRFRSDLSVTAVKTLAEATAQADIILTCTTARSPFLGIEHVKPGTFIAAIGADSADKSELTPGLLARSSVVVDSLDQCVEIGDLHHAVAAGTMKPGDVHATLAQMVSGERPGRRNNDEITVFDSTGVAVLDVAAAARIYERARERGTKLSSVRMSG